MVTCDSTISKMASEINTTEALQEESPKVWILRAVLIVASDAHLDINSLDVRWLKITVNNSFHNSTNIPNRIEIYGTASIADTKVTSWDEVLDSEIKQLPDASVVRPFIKIGKGASTTNIIGSELGYLGYEGEPKSHGLTYDEGGDGSVLANSSFHHMSFGVHPEGVGLILENNQFYNNVKYGINGHGLPYMIIRGNHVFNNTGHAAMSFSQNSGHIMIENNDIYNNSARGIHFGDSTHDSVIINNRVYNQVTAVSISASHNNQIHGNILTDSNTGIMIDSDVRKVDPNWLCSNCAFSELDAKSINNIILNNTIQNTQTAIRILGNSSTNNLFEANYLSENRIHVIIESAKSNTFRNNDLGPSRQNEFKLESNAGIIFENQTFTDDRISGQNGTNSVTVRDSEEIQVTADGKEEASVIIHDTKKSSFARTLEQNEILILNTASCPSCIA